MKRPYMRLWFMVVANLALLIGPAMNQACAYVGPGAGGGGRSGVGVASVLVFLLAAAVGLCVLCALIALVYAAAQRLRLWVRAKHSVDS